LFVDAEKAVAHGLKLLADGADVIDVGGESTRPGASRVLAAEEMERILPVIRGLRRQTDIPISVDTTKAAVAEEAIRAGADFVNDVSGFQEDPELPKVVARSGVACCLMHIQGTPQTMQVSPSYEDVVAEVVEFLGQALDRAERAGVDRSRIFVDPGIGFGKSVGHNLFLLRKLGDLRVLGRPILVGTSRKSFLGHLTQGKVATDRLFAALGSVAALAGRASADMVRVHDVAETRDALAVADAIRTGAEGGELFAAASRRGKTGQV
jgi:dihydropteroate synthase